MKNIIAAAVLLSTAALSAPVFAQGALNHPGDANGNTGLTRAEVRSELASAQAAGLSPQSFGRRDTAYLYGASQRASLAGNNR